MRLITTAIKDLIAKIKADSSLWSEDEETRLDPDYTGFRAIHNNRVFTQVEETDFPMLILSPDITGTRECSDGTGAVESFIIYVQISHILGDTDEDISDRIENITEKLYAVLDLCIKSPIGGRIEHGEDSIRSVKVHKISCGIFA